jgi:sugar lactone lactonase YvrE
VAAVSGTYFGQTVTADDIYTVAGDGTHGYSGDGGLPTYAKLYNPYGVALDGVGNLYIADTYNYVIRKVAPATEFPVTAVGATSASQNVLVQFTADTYVSSFAVPKAQNGAQEFTVDKTVTGCNLPGNVSAGDTCTVPVTFSPQYPGLRTGALEAMNGPNSIAGSVGLTGIGTGPLGVFDPGTASVVPTGTYTMSNVGGVAVAPTGDLYISDSAHNRVIEVSAGGTASLVNTGSVALSEPIGLAVDPAGNLFIANTGNGTVAEVSAEGTASLVNLSSITPQINPLGLAEDASGDLYIADRSHNRIVKVTASGVASVVSTGSLTLNFPNGVGVDSTGDLFIADRGNNRIVEVAASGVASVVVSSTVQFGGTALNNPSGVAVDSAEDIFITDLGNKRLVEYSAAGVASVIPTTGSASLNQPHDLVLDGAGDIYIANWGQNASGASIAVKVNQTQQTLNFASSSMGFQSTDSPQSATLQNAGNALLSITDNLTTVTTGQTSNSFNLDDSTTTC